MWENATQPRPRRDRRPLRRLRKVALWSLLVLTILVVGYFLAAIVLGLIAVNGGYKPPAEGIEIFVRSNGVHTGLILPVRTPEKSWPSFAPLVDAPATSASAMYVGFGWGDREVYLNTPTWADLSLATAVQSIFLPTSTLVHVSYWATTPKESERSVRLLLTHEQYKKLVAYITRTFALDASGKPKHVPGSGYDHDDTFYEANGSYHLFRTCNEWTNEGLAEIGVRAACWSPFETAIFYQLRQIE